MVEQNKLSRVDIVDIASHLQADTEVVESPIPTKGRRFTFGSLPTHLDIFETETETIVRVASGDLTAQLRRVTLSGVSEQGVVFRGVGSEKLESLLGVYTSGAVTLSQSPMPLPIEGWLADVNVEHAQLDAPAPSPHLKEHSRREAHTRQPNDPPAPAPTTGEQATPSKRQRGQAEKGKDDSRIEFEGVVTGKPAFHRSSKQGKLVCEFSVSVENDDGSTMMHQIVVFDERARLIRDGKLGAGDTVSVKGNKHVTEVKQDDGAVGQKTEVYAFLIKPQ